MKKYFISLFCILFLVSNVYASFLPLNTADAYIDATGVWLHGADGSSVRINRVASQMTKITSPVLSLKTAAEVTVKSTGGNIVKRALTSNVTKLIGGSIVGGIAIGGAVYLGEAYVDWLIAQGQVVDSTYHKKDGLIYKSVAGGPAPPCQPSGEGDFNYVGHFEAETIVSELWEASGTACNNETCVQGCTNLCSGYNSCWVRKVTNGYVWWWGTYGNPIPDSQMIEQKATESEIAGIANAAYDNDPDGWNAVVQHAIERMNQGLVNASDPIRSLGSGVNLPKVVGEYSKGFDPVVSGQIDESLDTGVGVMSPDDMINDDVVNDPVNVDMTQTNDLLTDINSKIGNDVEVPTDPAPFIPTKLSLTNVMQSFVNSLNQLPILNTLRGLTINCSGTSVLCLSLPYQYGGNQCVDFTSSTSTLNAIGTALLSITSIFMFAWVFKA